MANYLTVKWQEGKCKGRKRLSVSKGVEAVGRLFICECAIFYEI